MDDAMQPEGWTAVPNELLDHMGDLGNAELRVLLALIRKTAGYQKESDRVSVSQLATMTGLTTRNAQAAVTKLLEGGYIGREQASKQMYSYFVKPYPVGTRIDHIPTGQGEDTVSLGDTEPYPVGTRLPVKPYPVGTTQKKDLKKEESHGDGALAVPPPAPVKKRALKSPQVTQAELLDTPIAIYQRATNVRKPNQVQRELIESAITNLDAWRTVCEQFALKGWNVRNVANLVDAYQKRVAEISRTRAGSTPYQNGVNGHAEPFDYDSLPNPYEENERRKAARKAGAR
jgi:phage replication O-like protein O